jgi:hypothetical protein
MHPASAAIIIGQLALVGWLAWIIAGRLHDRARLRAELQGRMLERFASAQEFAAFLDSESGRRFLESVGGPGGVPAIRILRAVQAGIVLCALGIGIWIAGSAFAPRENTVLVRAGEVALALGMGFLIAAGVSYRLSRAWGLIPKRRTASTDERLPAV